MVVVRRAKQCHPENGVPHQLRVLPPYLRYLALVQKLGLRSFGAPEPVAWPVTFDLGAAGFSSLKAENSMGRGQAWRRSRVFRKFQACGAGGGRTSRGAVEDETSSVVAKVGQPSVDGILVGR